MRRIRPLHLVPASLGTFVGVLGAIILSYSGIGFTLEGPFIQENTPQSTLYNLATFLLMVVLGTIVLVLLVKFRKIKLINIFYGISIFISNLALVEIYSYALIIIFNLPENALPEHLVLASSISLSLLLTWVIVFTRNEAAHLIILVVFGGLIGSMFAFLLPLWSVVAISLSMSLYDIYSVFRGPLRYVIEEVLLPGRKEGRRGIPPIRGAIIPVKDLSIGLGDIIFYSLIASTSMLKPYPSLLRAIIVGMSVVAGNYVTLILLKKRSYVPALPIPIFLGMASMAACLLAGV